jgi:hypothetical protein
MFFSLSSSPGADAHYFNQLTNAKKLTGSGVTQLDGVTSTHPNSVNHAMTQERNGNARNVWNVYL